MAIKSKSMLLCAAAAVIVLPPAAHAQQQDKPRPAPTAPKVPPAATTPAPSAQTQAPAEPTQTAEDEPAVAADVVVTGFRASLESAINLKRDAITIRDSIVAEDIGKFPESNIAESLQRIPGVELVRDGNSNEGQTIQLRGLGSTFTVTTFNGSPVYTTSGGGVGNASRTFNYDVFPSELFGRADVYKAPLAELNEGGIAGVVDLQTPRPFDGKGGFKLRYAGSANYNDATGDWNPRGSFLVSATKGNFGALFTVAGAQTSNGRAGYQSTGTYSASSPTAADIAAGAVRSPIFGSGIGNNFNYNFTAPGNNLNGFTTQQIRDAILPRFLIVGVGANKRERLGAAGSLQYKDSRVNISLDGLYSVVSDDNQSSDVRWAIRDSVGALALVPVNVRVDGNNNLQGTLGNTQFNYASFFDNSETKYKYLALNGAFQVTSKLRISGQIAISDSEAFRNNITLSGDTRQQRHQITFDTTDAVFPTITTNRDLLDPATYITNGTATSGGPSYGGGYREERDRLKSGRLVIDWDYSMGDVEGHLKAGLVYNNNTKTLETRATNNLYNGLTIPGVGLYGATTTTLAQRNAFITSFLRPLDTRSFVPGAPSTLPQQFLAFDRAFAYGTLDAVNVNRAAALNLGSTYRAVEEIKAAFIQSDFTFDVFGRRLRLNTGVRVVETGSDVNNNVLVGGTFLPNNRKGSYISVLPSITAAYDLTSRLVVRVAAGKTLTRGAIQSIAASISLPSGGAGNLILNSGNPDLQPEFSTSLDGIVEWYFAKGGILSFAAYKKTITGRAAVQSTFVPFNTLGIPSSIFTVNLQNDLAANPALLVELRNPVNLDRYTLNGIEVAYQQQFKFLPAPFDGFGAVASFTRVFTQGLNRVYLGNTYAINDVPKMTYQASGYYEKGPISVRVSYNYKTEVANINQTSTNPIGFQRFANSRGYLDATAAYRFAPWLELRIDAANITNTQTYDFFRNFEGRFGDEESRLEGAVQNGRLITIGIRGAF